jgi:hypothetical protein
VPLIPPGDKIRQVLPMGPAFTCTCKKRQINT